MGAKRLINPVLNAVSYTIPQSLSDSKSGGPYGLRRFEADIRYYKTSAAALTTSILLCPSSTMRKCIAGVLVCWRRFTLHFSGQLAEHPFLDPLNPNQGKAFLQAASG